MKKILLLSLALPLTAFADEGGATSSSNILAQEAAGASKVEVRLSQRTQEVEFNTSTSEDSKSTLFAEYERGLNDMFSLAAAVAYSSGTIDNGTTEFDASGLEDFEFTLRGTTAAGGGLLRFGAVLGYALGDAEVDANGDRNYYSGGADLTPFVGFEKAWGNCIFGGKLSQSIVVTERTTDTNGTTSEQDGGEVTEFLLFYEHKFSEQTILGVSLHNVSIADTTSDGAETEALSPFAGLGVYVPITLGKGILKPELKYLTSSDDEFGGDAVDSATITSFTVGYYLPL